MSDAAPSALRRLGGLLREIVLLLALAVVLMVVIGRIRAPDLPDRAPDFELRTLEGERVVLSELRGRIVVLNFWATWCGPCRLEIPAFSSFAERNPDVRVLGLATDGTEAELRAAAPKLGIRYPVLRADEATTRAYGVNTLPTTVIIDAEGRIRLAHTGLLLGPQLALEVARVR